LVDCFIRQSFSPELFSAKVRGAVHEPELVASRHEPPVYLDLEPEHDGI
jgi:hypothetical protein